MNKLFRICVYVSVGSALLYWLTIATIYYCANHGHWKLLPPLTSLYFALTHPKKTALFFFTMAVVWAKNTANQLTA